MRPGPARAGDRGSSGFAVVVRLVGVVLLRVQSTVITWVRAPAAGLRAPRW